MLCADGIHRFPRLAKDEMKRRGLDKGLTRTQRYEIRVSTGDLPRGYNKITKKQKRLARLIVDGVPVTEACELVHVTPHSFYRWRRAHPLFRNYYLNYAKKRSGLTEKQLDALYPRAVRVVEDAMQSPDIYFAYDAAKDFLKGRGKYKTNIASKSEVGGVVESRVIADITQHGVGPEMILQFVNALVSRAQGQVIDVTPEPKKGLPSRASKEVHESQPGETGTEA